MAGVKVSKTEFDINIHFKLGWTRIFILYIKKKNYYYIFYLITKPTLDVALTVNHGHLDAITRISFSFSFMFYFNLKSWPEGLS